MEWLKDERIGWRNDLNLGTWTEPYALQMYRKNRESSLWRSTREVEKLCEYILYLEEKISLKEQINK